MTFEQFINIIISSFNSVFNLITSLFGQVINNNFVKLIIYIVLLLIIVDFIDEIIKFILNIFSQKKNLSKSKTTNNKTDIE